MSYRSPVLLASPAASSTGGNSRAAAPAGHAPVDSLPLLTPTVSSRLARSTSGGSNAAAGSPAAGPRCNAANLPPTGGRAAAYQQLCTPSFGSSRGLAATLSATRSPAFGTAGERGGIRPRAAAAAALAEGAGSSGGRAMLERQFGSINSRRLSAPTGYSESCMSDAATPSFSLQAPSGLSSDDDDEADSAAAGAAAAAALSSRRRRSSGASALGVRPLAPAELALAEVTTRLGRELRLHTEKKVAAFERALQAMEADEVAALTSVQHHRERQQRQVAASEAAVAAERQQQRTQLLTGLRSQHQQKAAEGERKVQQLEATVKQQQDVLAAAAAAVAKAQADMQAAAHAAVKAEQQRLHKAAENKAAAEKAAAEASQVAAAQRKQQQLAATTQASGLRIASSAAEWERQCAQALAAAQASVKPFVDDRVMRDKKRSIDKFVTLNVQQISATQDQIRVKAQALVDFMAAQHGAQRTYALLTLANKIISQCEVQVTRLHSFAFPLAEVAVAVMAAQPDFVPLLVARLHRVCPLTVPKYVVFRTGADDDAYLKQLGYKISTDEDTGQVVRETTDEFVGRMQGYIMLYSAAMQSDNPHNPHGMQHAWTLLARLLNALPANRVTATAVDAVLKVAGYRMHSAYRGQFMKLLQYIDSEFLPALGTSNDPDARAVYTRIQSYLRTAQFGKPPEGRDMPQFDASSYDRA